MGLAPTSAHAQPSDRLRAVVDSAVMDRVAIGVPGIVVGVYRDTVPVYVRAEGVTDRTTGRAYLPAQRQPIGSITKQITAVAVLALVDAGRLALDDTVGAYVPGFRASHAGVTVRQLLNQVGGIGRYEQRFALGAPASSDTVLRVIAAAPTEFAPGARFAYNNANYYLLGAIIERVTGRVWHEHLAEAFFAPLGMHHTAPCAPSPADTITGYMRAGGPVTARPPMPVLTTAAAGSLCSTVADLARWASALHHGRLLTPASYALLSTPAALPNGAPNAYGMGMVRAAIDSLPRLWHNGALTSGFNAQLAYYPADDLTIVVMANGFPAEVEEVDAAAYRAWRRGR